MKQPDTHLKLHPSCRDAWNPYIQRDSFTPILDKGVFKSLLGSNYPNDYIDPSLFMTGCLDAPRDIPCGSTQSVHTVGGWDRKEYSRHNRESHDHKANQRAQSEVAILLKKIISEQEELDEE
jgi:hypothetical protein